MATKAEIQALIDEIVTGGNYRAEQMRPLLTAMLDYSKPYKVYTALLTQTGTDAPVATVLENTLGGTVVWSYNAVGSYIANLNGAFVEGKTAVIFQYNYGDTVNASYTINTIDQAPDNIYLNTYDSGTPDDGLLNNDMIEIRVYD